LFQQPLLLITLLSQVAVAVVELLVAVAVLADFVQL
jgi:hypothetical protein